MGRVGRVFLLQSGTIIASMSLVFVGIGFILNDNTGNILILVGLFIFMGNFGMTLGPVFWLYVAEIV